MSRPPSPHHAVEPRQPDAENVTVEEEQGAERDILRRGGDVRPHGQVGEELPDLFRPHLGGVALAVEEDEAFNPVRVSLLGAEAQVAQAGGRAHASQELGLTHGREGHKVC